MHDFCITSAREYPVSSQNPSLQKIIGEVSIWAFAITNFLSEKKKKHKIIFREDIENIDKITKGFPRTGKPRKQPQAGIKKNGCLLQGYIYVLPSRIRKINNFDCMKSSNSPNKKWSCFVMVFSYNVCLHWPEILDVPQTSKSLGYHAGRYAVDWEKVVNIIQPMRLKIHTKSQNFTHIKKVNMGEASYQLFKAEDSYQISKLYSY